MAASSPPLRSVLMALFAALSGGGALHAQCCGGAADFDAASPDGRYRVEARSQTGTGPAVHGPYHYAFRFSERDDRGSYEQRGSFELRFPVRNHFAMRVIVSPTGNGFLLATSLAPDVVLYGRDGCELGRLSRGSARELSVELPSADGLFVDVELIEDLDRRRYTTVRTRVFVPLGAAVGPEMQREPPGPWRAAEAGELRFPQDRERVSWLRRMLAFDPGVAERQAGQVRRALERLRSIDERAAAIDDLVSLGLAAREPMRRRLAAEPPPAVEAALRMALLRIDELCAGHPEPHRDRALLEALQSHPDLDLAAEAKRACRSLTLTAAGRSES